MKRNLVVILASMVIVSAFTSFNSKAEELNTRMLSNKVNNDITHIRLQALLSKNSPDPLGSQKNFGSVFGDDCNMNIGNSTGGQGLLSKPQTIIITGPVVNKCR